MYHHIPSSISSNTPTSAVCLHEHNNSTGVCRALTDFCLTNPEIRGRKSSFHERLVKGANNMRVNFGILRKTNAKAITNTKTVCGRERCGGGVIFTSPPQESPHSHCYIHQRPPPGKDSASPNSWSNVPGCRASLMAALHVASDKYAGVVARGHRRHPAEHLYQPHRAGGEDAFSSLLHVLRHHAAGTRVFE
ncbi:unnamed protein product, partial [Ectocarpus sp. 8 AP-2014]